MNRNFYNLLVYICLLIQGLFFNPKPRLDKKQNDIHDKIIIAGFIFLCILALIGFVAICFLIKPPEYWSMQLA